MATKPKAQQIREARSAGTMFESISAAIDANKVPQFRDFITGVVDEVGLKEIIKAFADALRDGSPALRNKNALEFAALLKQYQQLTGDGFTKDEVSRMSDECIEQMLVDDFGLIKGNAMQDAAKGVSEIMRRFECSPFAVKEVLAFFEETFGVEMEQDGSGRQDSPERKVEAEVCS